MSLFSFFAGKFLFALAALLPIINPPGLIPIFLSLTSRNTREQRQFLARRIAIYGFVLLAGSMFIGSYLLSFFGVSLPVVQLGGGLLLTFNLEYILRGIERTFDVVLMPEDVYYVTGLPIDLQAGDVVMIATIALALAFLALMLSWLAPVPDTSLRP